VVCLGQVELGEGNDLGKDLATSFRSQPIEARLSQPLLLLVVIKDERGVLIRPGAASGAVTAPEQVQQILVAYLIRIIVDLDRFAMVSQILIGGILRGATCISNTGADYSGETPKLGVGSPESAQRKGSRFDTIACGRARRCGCPRFPACGRPQARLPGGLGRLSPPSQGNPHDSGRRQQQAENQYSCFGQTCH
jgi:hypothetical protein